MHEFGMVGLHIFDCTRDRELGKHIHLSLSMAIAQKNHAMPHM